MVSCRRTAPYTVPVFLVSGPVLGSEEAISECLLTGFDVSVFFALSRSSRDRLFAALWTGSSAPGILQASTLERAAVPSPGAVCAVVLRRDLRPWCTVAVSPSTKDVTVPAPPVDVAQAGPTQAVFLRGPHYVLSSSLFIYVGLACHVCSVSSEPHSPPGTLSSP